MNLLYDLSATQGAGGFKHHGGGKYAIVVFKKLLEVITSDIVLFALYNNKYELDPDIKNSCTEKKIKLIHLSNQNELNNIFHEFKIDRFYTALATPYHNAKLENIQFRFTLHGLRYIEMPGDKYEIKFTTNLKAIIKYYVKRILPSRYISIQKNNFLKMFNICKDVKYIYISNHTKYTVINNFPDVALKEAPVYYSPLYEEAILSTTNEEAILNQYSTKKAAYFLLVSGSVWIKNNFRALQALDNIYSNFPGITQKTIITGVVDHKIFSFIKNKNQFVFLSYVNQQELEVLYKNAFTFIYPSLNEGFGYPPLEAMKYGTPVLASAISSIPEVCSNAVLYFNPYAVEEIQAKIIEIAMNRETRTRLSENGIKRYREVSTKQQQDLENLAKWIIS